MEVSPTTDPTLSRLLDEAKRPVYVVSGRGRIVFCNRALAEWLQLNVEQILGRGVEYHSERAEQSSTIGDATRPPLTDLSPPPRSLAGEESVGTLSCVDRNGHLVHRRGRFIPLSASSALGYPLPDSRQGEGSGEGTIAHEGSGDGRDNGVGEATHLILVVLDARNLSPAELAQSLAAEPDADQLHRAIRQFRRGRKEHYAIGSLLGESTLMDKVRAQVRAAAECRANVLVLGRVGSGRTRVAKTIHYESCRDERAILIPLDGNLLTQESLRRAVDHVAGEAAVDRGTLLVTDVDAVEPEIQWQLVTALGERRRPPRVLATLAAAEPSVDGQEPPTRVLPELRDALSTITIRLPRLVERLADLPLLAQLFLEAANRDSPKQVGAIGTAALDRLALYSWPGELRELKQVMAYSHNGCQSAEIGVNDLPDVIHHAAQAASLAPRPAEQIVLDDFLARIERELVERAMRQAGGNKTEAARLLGMNRARLYRRLEQLDFETKSEE